VHAELLRRPTLPVQRLTFAVGTDRFISFTVITAEPARRKGRKVESLLLNFDYAGPFRAALDNVKMRGVDTAVRVRPALFGVIEKSRDFFEDSHGWLRKE